MGIGPGTLLGTNILLERELGRGAMGEVWLAENRSLSSKVAVKILHPKRSSSEGVLARFQQEARSVANIDSPHVVKIFDFGMTPDGEPYIVMELLHGRDLRELIEQSGTLSPDQTAKIFGQLGRALGRAHELGVIHRDIKPANIFIVESDGEPFVKVLDFGIARIHKSADLDLTETGALMGTPYYMSPEQFVDPRRIDHRSDLWSAAIVAYGCLMGTLPFLGETVGALSLAVHAGRFVLPSQQNPQLPVALDAFFQRALQVDPDHRYATARELSQAFAAACGSVSSSQAPHLAAAPSPAAAPFAAGAPSHAAPASNQPLATTGVPSAASPIPTPNVFTQTGPPPAEKKSSSAVLFIGAALAVLGLGSLGLAVVLPALRSDEQSEKRTARADDDEDGSKTDSGKKKKRKKKKKGNKKKSDKSDDDAPSVSPKPAPTASAAEPDPKPAPSGTPSAAPSADPPSPAPAPAPVAPQPAPRPAPQRYAYIGTACRAYSNKSCPAASQCCRAAVGGGPRDVTQYTPPAAGKDYGTCKCMRPVCRAGENWSTHQCIIR